MLTVLTPKLYLVTHSGCARLFSRISYLTPPHPLPKTLRCKFPSYIPGNRVSERRCDLLRATEHIELGRLWFDEVSVQVQVPEMEYCPIIQRSWYLLSSYCLLAPCGAWRMWIRQTHSMGSLSCVHSLWRLRAVSVCPQCPAQSLARSMTSVNVGWIHEHTAAVSATGTQRCCCSVAKLCPTLCNPMDCNTPSFLVLYYLLEFGSDSCPLSWWCHPTISSSAAPFSSCPQPFPASGSFPVSQLIPSGGQSIGASASVLPIHIYLVLISFRIDCFDLLAVWGTLKSLL